MAKWSDEQKVFMEWLSLPKEMREPATQHELAKELRVTDAVLSRWKAIPGFWEGVEQVHIKKLRERLGELYEALFQLAVSGKHPKYMEMAFQLAKEQFGAEKKVSVTITKEEAQVMTTEKLAERAYSLLANVGFDSISQQDFIQSVTRPKPELEEARIISETNNND
jgi:hypothetical protein